MATNSQSNMNRNTAPSQDVSEKNPKNKESALYVALTRLFSGPVTSYRQQSQIRYKRRDLDRFKFTSASGQSFKKKSYNPFEAIQSNIMANQSRAERYSDFDQMEFCLHGDTKIAVPGGYKTLKELTSEYGLDKEFIVYSFDHSKQQIVPALGRQARKTRTDHAWKVTFENGQYIIGTADHRLMMRDGTYRTISDLKTGDAMMPFYRKDLIRGQKDEGDGYRWIYTMHNDEGRKKGWIAEHILIAEWIAGRRIDTNEVVHHKNFIKYDNSPDNLEIMNNDAHLAYHQSIINEQRKNSGWWEEFRKKHSEYMKQNNPAERKDITFEKILYLCDIYGFHQNNICKMLDTEPPTIKRKLKAKGFVNFEMFAKAYSPDWKNAGCDNTGNKNPRYDHSLNFEKICSVYEKGMKMADIAHRLETTEIKVKNRIKSNGFKTFKDFEENYQNHKVQSVEYYGFIDLYDLTVDGYKNFATDSIISHNTPEIASALDIYADEMTTSNLFRPLLVIDCKNEEIRSLLHTLYYKILNVEQNLYGWCRTMCKFGDFFLYLDIDEKLGIKSVLGLPSPEVERLEGEDESNPNYVQFQWNSAGITFENWQIAHFRIGGQDKYLPYGTSVLEPARRIWRQLQLMEDAMMAYRIVRSPERRVFYIDVGNVSPPEVEQFMQKMVTQMKRNQIVDPSTGRVDLRYNPMSIDEDYFLPVRGTQTGTKIDTLKGGEFTGDIDDVQYLRDKLFSALKIPQAYLARGKDAPEDKTTLAQKDIRFARTIQRLQKVVVTELEKIGIIHLYTLGYRNEDLLKFRIRLNNPSRISELQEIEHFKAQLEVAAAAKENGFSKRWVFENIFKINDSDFTRIQRDLFYDKQFEKAVEAGDATDTGAVGGSTLNTDLGAAPAGAEVPEAGGETPTPGEEIGGEVGAAESEPESSLLAAPARREDGSYMTKGANGKWYKPVTHDSRGSGARTRHISSQHSPESVKSTYRNIFAGSNSLSQAGRGIFNEGEEDNLFEKDEKMLLEMENKLKSLSEKLLKEEKDTENK